VIIQDANLKPIGLDVVRAVEYLSGVSKNFVESSIESIRQLEGELERRRIFSRFECDDRLTSDSAGVREFRLRHRRARETPFAYPIGDAQAPPL